MFIVSNMQKGFAQTIAVADFSTNGLHVTPTIASKLARLELVKLNKYVVMDQLDMMEIIDEKDLINCYGKNCLIDLGKQLNVPYILAGSIDGLGNKIVVSIKLIDVQLQTIKLTKSKEFDNQEEELQRMIGIVLNEMHDLPVNPDIEKMLAYKNELIISNNVGRMNNSGPRIGFAYIHESELQDFMLRPENQGGMDIIPFVSNMGYQFEKQYIGTENFSALAEFIINVGGMEQGQFIPTFSVLNGFRIGTQGWELAFGPSFGIRKESLGFFTEEGKNLFGREPGRYWTRGDFYNAGYSQDILEQENYTFDWHLDKRGQVKINTNWLMAFGRTFKAGALNIPFNIYYSHNKYGGSFGTSVGFNVTTNRTRINK